MRKELPLVELEITSWDESGHGRASWNDHPVIVSFAVPGDVVQARLFPRRKRIYRARIEELIKPSPHRIEPRCAHFSLCGGCRWQQIDYQEQLALKEARIRDWFSFHADVEHMLQPIVPCVPPWYYRNKMELTFSQDRDENHYLGLVMDGGRGRAINIDECHLCPPWMVELAEAIRIWWKETGLEAYRPHRDTGSLRTLMLREGRRTGDRMVVLIASGRAEYAIPKEHLESFQQVVRQVATPEESEAQLSLYLRIHQAIRGQPTQLYELVLGGADHIRERLEVQDRSGEERSLTFSISPQAFFQPNTRQAEQLYTLAMDTAEISSDDIVYDLYSGTGTLACAAGLWAKQVVGIELSPDAVLDARTNIAQNGLDNVTMYGGDVGKVLDELEEPKPTVVLIDPPRAGLDGRAQKALLALEAPKLVYISCNPKTQARDVEYLQSQGYRLVSLQPVDQFPHTVHIETIACLIREK